jgi:radical SAM superfamily enzyme YgiQ (UPF0313 family)
LVNIVLISTYELGRQPFGLASPAAWLRQEGASVTCLDLSRQRLEEEAIRAADLIAFYVPMHTATRIATQIVGQLKTLNPDAELCFYGLYASVNEDFLRKLGVDTILGGEFEEGLVSLVRRLRNGENGGTKNFQPEPLVSLAKQRFLVPDRSDLAALSQYARLNLGNGQKHLVGYTEASRGCKHLCRHCPIVPVYQGAFRIVQQDVVLDDIERQVAAGAQHITFGDPDFFNGIRHSIGLVNALHQRHPNVTYDATIKVAHLLKHSHFLPVLRDTGCLFVISAVESVDDRILSILDKGHTREDFVRVVQVFKELRLGLNPTFVTFTPWTSMEGYLDLLLVLVELNLIEQVAPIQLAIRLLIPASSRLLELPETRDTVGGFDEAALCYSWRHSDPRMDQLHKDVLELVKAGDERGETRQNVFAKIWTLAHEAAGVSLRKLPDSIHVPARATIPYLEEPWYC